MRVEDGPQSHGCSNPRYCRNGKPKPYDELKPKKDRNKENGGSTPTHTPQYATVPTSSYTATETETPFSNYSETPNPFVSNPPIVSTQTPTPPLISPVAPTTTNIPSPSSTANPITVEQIPYVNPPIPLAETSRPQPGWHPIPQENPIEIAGNVCSNDFSCALQSVLRQGLHPESPFGPLYDVMPSSGGPHGTKR